MAEARQEIQQGRMLRAEQLCAHALQIEPRHGEALHLMGVACGQTGRNGRAVELIVQALELTPSDAMAHTNLAVSLHALGRDAEALAHLHEAGELAPESTHMLRNYAVVLSDLGRWGESAAYLRRWSKLEPSNPAVYRWLGDWHSRQNLREQAIPHYLKALELDPGDVDAANNLGACLADTGRRETALALLCKVVELNPDHAGAWGNLGVAAKNLGDLATALRCFDRVLALEPTDAKAQWNRSLCLLGMGKLAEGWTDYEWRWKSGAVPREAPSKRPMWDGSDPGGKRMLVWAEQGLGDQIAFSSLIPDLMRAGARCVVECQNRLVKLFERSFRGVEIVPMCEPPHPRTQQLDIDYQAPMASLARWYRRRLEDFPEHRGYLVADSSEAARWRERLDALGEGLKVGISWRSGMARGMRSMQYSQLGQWGPILGTTGVHFVNLQYDECREELLEAERLFGVRAAVWSDMDLKNDQDRLAALIASLDLVISAGTAVDQMAGAVGTPTWVLTRGSGDWWSLGTDHCPWYPSVRVFRAGAAEPWGPAVARMGSELNKMAAARCGTTSPQTVGIR